MTTLRVRLAGGDRESFVDCEPKVGQDARLDVYRGETLIAAYPEGAWRSFLIVDGDQADVAQQLDKAWGIIAEAWDGDWRKAPESWRTAAEEWRDVYTGKVRA